MRECSSAPTTGPSTKNATAMRTGCGRRTVRRAGKPCRRFGTGLPHGLGRGSARRSRADRGRRGSRYVEIPVRITAVTTDGARQAFIGTYTLRRSVVDGATPEQRAWRIHSAKIRPVSP